MMKINIHEKSAYAPIRYEATRKYARQIGRLFMMHANRGEASRLRFVGHELLSRMREEVARLGPQEGPGPVQAEVVNVQVFGGFDAGGRIIFDVARPLTESLLLTDAGDIPCGELVFPAPNFYLHFGPAAGLSDEGGVYEGAFVTHLGKILLLDLVPVNFGHRLFYRMPLGEPLVAVRIDLSEPTRTVLSALEKSVDDVLATNRRNFEQLAQFEEELTARYGQIVKAPMAIECLEGRGPLLKMTMQLVVNLMFYLAAEPEDVHEDWSADTPQNLIDQSRDPSAKPGTRKTAENSLSNMGYLKVKYVGTNYAESNEAHKMGEAILTGRVLSTHIRRGHFRRQAYGQDRALRKMIFVAPVVVNVSRSADSPGRIYEV